jgi:hypothetical protein
VWGSIILMAVVSATVRAHDDRVVPLVSQQEGVKSASDPGQQVPPQTKEGGDSNRETAIKHASVSSNDKDVTSVNAITGLGQVSPINYKPLTGHQRWQFYLSQNFTSFGSYFGPVMVSIIDQADGDPPEWGGGMGGYGKRLGSRIGTGVIQGSVQSAGCAALGQDPRYIRSADPRILHRIGHAFVYTLITYNNEGKNRLALATLGSYYASSMITSAWYPSRYTALGDGVRDGNRQVILAGLVNQFQEFWPEINRYVFRRK